MSFESTQPNNESANKEIFISELERELKAMLVIGRITQEKIEEKLASAKLIEEGLSANPKKDARMFAWMGIANEEELNVLLDMEKTDEPVSRKKENPETTAVNELVSLDFLIKKIERNNLVDTNMVVGQHISENGEESKNILAIDELEESIGKLEPLLSYLNESDRKNADNLIMRGRLYIAGNYTNEREAATDKKVGL